jgi:hypothetical protein
LVYDVNKDKTISKEEAFTAFTEISKQSKIVFKKEDVKDLVDQIFEKVDINNDGSLTREELTIGLENDGIKNTLLLQLPRKDITSDNKKKIVIIGKANIKKRV